MHTRRKRYKLQSGEEQKTETSRGFFCTTCNEWWGWREPNRRNRTLLLRKAVLGKTRHNTNCISTRDTVKRQLGDSLQSLLRTVNSEVPENSMQRRVRFSLRYFSKQPGKRHTGGRFEAQSCRTVFPEASAGTPKEADEKFGYDATIASSQSWRGEEASGFTATSEWDETGDAWQPEVAAASWSPEQKKRTGDCGEMDPAMPLSPALDERGGTGGGSTFTESVARPGPGSATSSDLAAGKRYAATPARASFGCASCLQIGPARTWTRGGGPVGDGDETRLDGGADFWSNWIPPFNPPCAWHCAIA